MSNGNGNDGRESGGADRALLVALGEALLALGETIESIFLLVLEEDGRIDSLSQRVTDMESPRH